MSQIQNSLDEFNQKFQKSFDYQYYNTSYNGLKKTGSLYEMLNFCNGSYYNNQKQKENEEVKQQYDLKNNESNYQKNLNQQNQKDKKKKEKTELNDNQKVSQDLNSQIAQQKVLAILKSYNLCTDGLETVQQSQPDPVVLYNQNNPFDVSNFIKSEMQKEYMQIIKQNPMYPQYF